MPDLQPQTNVWANNLVGREYDFVVPSGQLCRIRKKPLENLLLEGVIDDIDSLTALVETDIVKKRGRRPGTPQDRQRKSGTKPTAAEGLQMMKDENFRKSIEIMDKVIIAVVVEPQLHPNPVPGEKPEDGKIYIQQVSLPDKTAIFKEVMSSVQQAEQFREESDEAVEPVPDK